MILATSRRVFKNVARALRRTSLAMETQTVQKGVFYEPRAEQSGSKFIVCRNLAQGDLSDIILGKIN
jgi:hypothetical protein